MTRKLFFTLLHVLVASVVSAQSYIDETFTEYFRRTSGWTAGDATISVPLPDGRNIWLFGDSYINNYDSSDNTIPCLFQVRNSMMVQNASDLNSMTTHLDYTKTGINQTYFKIGSTVGSTVFWPGHGFVKEDTAFIFLERYNGTTYAFLGDYIAKIQLPSMSLISITLLPAMSDLYVGKSVLHDDASGYYYIYCNKLNWIVYEPYVARSTFENLVSGNWEFYTGGSWSANPADAEKISNEIVSPEYSVVKIKGAYYLITQDNGYLSCDLGRDIFSYHSSSPAGPFTTPKKLYTVEDQINGHYLLTYNAFAHPQFTANDELLISYNVNDWNDTTEPYVCPSQCQNVFTDRMDADSYRPKFVRVPFAVMGIKSGDLQGIEINPNPVMLSLLSKLISANPQSVTITIMNKMGQIMEVRRNVSLNKGENELYLDISVLPPDVYFMVVNSEGEPNHSSLWERKMFVKN